VFKGTSSDIQNDIINCIAQTIQQSIEHEINECRFFSIMLDEATDIGKLSHLSIIFRYVLQKNVLI